MVTEQQLKEYYNRRHREMGADAWRPAEAFPVFLEMANATPGMTMLDVGCGTGFLVQAAIDAGIKANGIDISEEAAAIARKHNPSADIRVGSGETLPFDDDSFDCVFCLGALEHFIDMHKGMMEMVRVAKPGAVFCVVVPNVDFLGWRFRRRKGTTQQDINEKLYSCREWRVFFEKCGLAVEQIKQDRWWFVNRWRYMADASWWRRVKALLRGLLWRIMPLRATYQFVFIMRKNETMSDGKL